MSKKFAIEIWGGDVQGDVELFDTRAEADKAAVDAVDEMNADGIDGIVSTFGLYAGFKVYLDTFMSEAAKVSDFTEL